MTVANAIERIRAEWERCLATLAAGPFFRRLAAGSLGLEHYKSFLREEYFNTTENPKIMALFFSRLDTDRYREAAKLLKHTAMEVGHNEMAMDDLKALGEDTEAIRTGHALPSTDALAAFIIFQIEHRNPLAFLGYIYHLEAISERMAGGASDVFGRLGVPESARSFLKEHADADPTHNKWNQDYIEAFVKDEEGLEAVLHGLRGTCLLHALMFQGVIDRVDGTGSSSAAQWSPAKAGA